MLDNRVLINTERHADAVVNLASTITLDAAVCDRLTIGIAYDLRAGAPSQPDVDAYDQDVDHFQVVADGAHELARSPAAPVAAINVALARPEYQREGRRRAVAIWCGTVDGRAGERLAKAWLAMAERRTA